MAIYKVIQDVEAEDTLIGPLTLKQCVYAGIAVVAAYLSFVAVAKGASFALAVLLPFVFIGAFLAFPWSKQQPTEVWALAKIRFFLKPRRRIWDQSGISELVTITAPKKIERILTNGLSESEVRSRLKALADTIDTRGWAVKNVGLAEYTRMGQFGYDTSDRLLSAAALPQQTVSFDPSTVVDMLDARSNPQAERLERMMHDSAAAHRQKIVTQINQPAATALAAGQGQSPADYWYLDQPAAAVSNDVDEQAPAATPPVLSAAISPSTEDETYSASPVTPAPKPATLELANNDDLSVATIAREAQRLNAHSSDEVVISLR